MLTVRGFLKSRVRHVFSAVLVVLGVLTIIPAFSGSAAAHHAEASASVNCAGVISYNTAAWAGYGDDPATLDVNENHLSRTNPGVRVWIEVIGSGSPISEQFGDFSLANGFSFSGSFQWPAGETGTIRLQAQALGTWGNGGTAGPYAWPVDLTLPTDCEETTTTTTEPSTTTTVEGSTTTTEGSTTTTEGSTTTTEGSTTTTEGSTTTTEQSTTTTVVCQEEGTTTTSPSCGGTTTTTQPATTTTVSCGDGTTTTSPSCGGTTTTTGVGCASSGGCVTTTTVRRPTTTVSGTLPRSGGGVASQSMLSMSVGFGCIGGALLLSRPRLPRRWRAAFN
ncbi:MAG: hypothetical protein ABL953_02110 [Ilumatobacteraceae bacterium]